MKATIRLSPAEVLALVTAHVYKIACLKTINNITTLLDNNMDQEPVFEGVDVEVELSEV